MSQEPVPAVHSPSSHSCLDLSDAGLHSACSCKRKKEATETDGLGGPGVLVPGRALPTTSHPGPSGPCFLHGLSRVPGKVGNTVLWRRFTPSVPSFSSWRFDAGASGKVADTFQNPSGTVVRWWLELELLPQMAILSFVPRWPGFATLPA